MKPRRIKRLFGSVFTRLLVATLAAGLAITFTVIAGFVMIRLHSQSAFERNLMLYADYLVDDQRSGMVIRFDHPDQVWQTGPLPRFFNFDRAWTRHHSSGLTLGNSKGHHFIRLAHGGGELTFLAPRDVHRGELAIWFLVAMAVATITILGAAYLFIRKTLNPLRTLKAGVNTVGAGKLGHRLPEPLERKVAGEHRSLGILLWQVEVPRTRSTQERIHRPGTKPGRHRLNNHR